MPIVSEGTLVTTVGGAAEPLDLIASEGSFILKLDLSAMLNGDTLSIIEMDKVGELGALGQFKSTPVSNIQSEPVYHTIPMRCTHECEFLIDHISGASISIPWEVVSI